MDQVGQRDLFISCAAADEAWVLGYLLPELGLAADRVLTRQDFRLGQSIAREVERAVSSTRYTVLVMSRAYFADEWAGFGEDLATWSGVESNAAKLIPLALERIELPARLNYQVRLECTTEALWPEAARQLREFLQQAEPGPERVPPCPYPGMRAFKAKEEDQYFGRSALIESTIKRLRLESFLALLGPSGSGKSSFLHAGVVPRLDRNPLLDSREVNELQCRPGTTPLANLAAQFGNVLAREPANVFGQLKKDPASVRGLIDEITSQGPDHALWLLVVDQFEEAFAPSVDAKDRSQFFGCLDAALAALPEQWRVIIAVRADFYDDCQESILWPRIEAGLLNLPPLSHEGLREAIREPAGLRGVFVEPALIERLIDDAEDEPGPLPLLQEAMVLLWSSHLRRRLLTLASYDGLSEDGHSGLQIAMRDRAEATIKQLKEPGQAEIARRIFVRLTEFAERRNTRRQQSLEDLTTPTDDEAAVRAVIDVLVAHGLLTTDRDVTTGEPLVDLAHEKLIEAWPRLADWLHASEPIEAERRALKHAAESWEKNKRDRSYAYTGRRLKTALDWAEGNPKEVGDDEKRFLEASIRANRMRLAIRYGAITAGVVAVVGLATPRVLGELDRRGAGSPLQALAAGPAVLYEGSPEPSDHELSLAAFQIETHEVSIGQYLKCINGGRCDRPFGVTERDWAERRDYPITWVSADQAKGYCAWIGRRLPTSLEWQRAVRGTDGRLAPWVGELPPSFEFPTDLVPVGSVPETATPDGIYDLIDNAGEWVLTTPTTFAIAGGIETSAEPIGAVTPSGGLPDPKIGLRCAVDRQ